MNGKVERSQRTDLDEFYSSTDPKDQELQSKLMIWEEYYNKHRSHSSLHGRTPWEKYKELGHTIPSIEEVHKSYDSSKETFASRSVKKAVDIRDNTCSWLKITSKSIRFLPYFIQNLMDFQNF